MTESQQREVTVPRVGEEAPNSKLTEADIRHIRSARSERGTTQAALASIYGVTQACISHIINRKTWKHVE